ncbi:MAG: hypothetical protein NC120_01115 [Ruminococcus sp.]|nr:hypothetical protein [Ruminococcus sp.]
MKRSIFGTRGTALGVTVDSFFTELALAMPVFALCCCAVLQMLAVSRGRARTEETKAAAIACAQSWCDIYRGCGSAEKAAEELFGELPAECMDGSSFAVPADMCRKYFPDRSDITIKITEKTEDSGRNGIVCGQLYTSDIQILWQDGEISASSVCYNPFPAVVHTENAVTEEGR